MRGNVCYPEQWEWLLLLLSMGQVHAELAQISLLWSLCNAQVQGADGASSQHHSLSKISHPVAQTHTRDSFRSVSYSHFKWLMDSESLATCVLSI